ncbi:unnamed protein product [Onchocerca ochengi]|uniref:ATP-dependent DNA helicase n=1 Tax=Onchocerca ochengi TaxID=42157 RepID=A0A182EHJ3_ONCOC|nr:unnamed protein product [Onchocerca ochengi]
MPSPNRSVAASFDVELRHEQMKLPYATFLKPPASENIAKTQTYCLDECTMMRKKSVEALDRLLQNLDENIRPFEATILTEPFKGEDVLIPRISPTDMPFQFKTLQFPIRLAFAFTINKFHGQSLELCGVDLETDCYSHE